MLIWKTQGQKKYHLMNLKWKKCCQVSIVPCECAYTYLCVCSLVSKHPSCQYKSSRLSGFLSLSVFLHLLSVWHAKIDEKIILSSWHCFLSWLVLFQFPAFCIGLLHRTLHFGKGGEKFFSFPCFKMEGISFLWCLNLIISSSIALRRTACLLYKKIVFRYFTVSHVGQQLSQYLFLCVVAQWDPYSY